MIQNMHYKLLGLYGFEDDNLFPKKRFHGEYASQLLLTKFSTSLPWLVSNLSCRGVWQLSRNDLSTGMLILSFLNPLLILNCRTFLIWCALGLMRFQMYFVKGDWWEISISIIKNCCNIKYAFFNFKTERYFYFITVGRKNDTREQSLFQQWFFLWCIYFTNWKCRLWTVLREFGMC